MSEKPPIIFPSDSNYIDNPNTIEFHIWERRSLKKNSTTPVTTIVLPAPAQINISSTSNWSGVSFGFAGKDLNNMYNTSTSSPMEKINEYTKQYLGNYQNGEIGMIPKQIGASMLSVILQGLGSNATADDILGYNEGIVVNPYLSASYKGTDLRSFQFNFSFFPKNKEDCEKIKSIISEFNKAHLPGKGQDGTDKWYLEYPREFDIQINVNGERNPYLIPYKTSVMTSFAVDYTGGLGFFNTFPNGFPIQTNLTIGFMETTQQTREEVDNLPNRGI